VALSQCQLLGGHGLVALDRQRADVAAQQLSAVPGVPSTTAASLARRFGPEQLAGIEAGNAALLERVLPLLPQARRDALVAAGPTIDVDSTDVEVYGPRKRGVAFNYRGQRAGRPHLATWAQAGVTVSADLLAGNDDVQPRAADLLRRALAAIPAEVSGRPRVRAYAGYFTADLAHAADEAGCDYAIAAKRNTAIWRAHAAIPDDAWLPADGMPGAQVASVDHAPGGWPDDAYTIVRRVRVDAADISHDPRARRRRTIPADQLTLALDGDLDHVWAVSFIVTNIPQYDPEDAVETEAWFRRRTDIEDRIRDAKHGAALRHLPSGHHQINAVWTWAALLACNLPVLLQLLTGLDDRGRAHGQRLRRELICVPARILRHARGLELRLPPGPQILPEVLARLRALPKPA
jgi:Transposase DDE domain group 1